MISKRRPRRAPRQVRGGAVKKRVALQSTTPLNKSSTSSFGSKASTKAGQQLERFVENKIKDLGGSNADFERVTAAIEKRLKQNDEITQRRERELTEMLRKSQEAQEREDKAAQKKLKKKKALPKRDCGRRKVVPVRAHVRCGGKKKNKEL